MHLGYGRSAGSNGEASTGASPSVERPFVCDLDEAVFCQTNTFTRL